jgi:hypothetical protein
MQREFVNDLIVWTMEGRLNCVWSAIPNEVSSNRSPAFGAMLRALGKIKGAPDMVFLWNGGSGFIEFKYGKNTQTKEQKIYQEWCDYMGVNYSVAYSRSDAINILKQWGVLIDK